MQHFIQDFQLQGAAVTRIGALETALRDALSFEEFHAGSHSAMLREAILEQAQSAKVVSLDIFDTVLWRDGKSELERFADIATRFADLVGSREMCAFLMARINCASHAYQLSEVIENTTEGRLSDIALNIMHALRMKGDRQVLADRWCEIELEVETEQLRVAPFIDELIDQLVEQGKTIIFLSDMYLQAEQIRVLLDRNGFDMSRVTKLISTADERVNKRSGTIFPRIASAMNVKPQDFLHMGDSLSSDFRKPIEAGWMARHLPVPRAVLMARRESHFVTCAKIFGQRQISLPMAAPTL